MSRKITVEISVVVQLPLSAESSSVRLKFLDGVGVVDGVGVGERYSERGLKWGDGVWEGHQRIFPKLLEIGGG